MVKEGWKVIGTGIPCYISPYGSVIHDDGQYRRSIVPQVSNKGYLRVIIPGTILPEARAHDRYSVHRLVAYAYLEPPTDPTRTQVNHIDGDKLNNHYTNLEWITGKENVKHAYETGLRTDSNIVLVQDIRTDKIHTFISVHQAAKYLNISDEAVTVWKVRSKYVPIDNRYVIKEVNVRTPGKSIPLYVFDHVDDVYHMFENRMAFVLTTGLSPYTCLEKLKRYKIDPHYIAGYSVSLTELKDIDIAETALKDRIRLFSKPPVKMVTPITAKFPDGRIKDYDSIKDLVKERPDIRAKLVNIALSRSRSTNQTYMVCGVNLRYRDSDIPFTEYNEHAVANSINGLRTSTSVYKLTYPNADTVHVRGIDKLSRVMGSSPSVTFKKYKLNICVTTKDANGKSLVVEKIN